MSSGGNWLSSSSPGLRSTTKSFGSERRARREESRRMLDWVCQTLLMRCRPHDMPSAAQDFGNSTYVLPRHEDLSADALRDAESSSSPRLTG